MKERMAPKLKWSLNVGGDDDVLYRLPRFSNTSSLIEDHWCQVPYYFGGTTKDSFEQQQHQTQSWLPKGSVEVAIFQPSSSNKQLELTIHDPHTEQSSSYQLDVNDEVLKMQVMDLVPGQRPMPNKSGSTIDDNQPAVWSSLEAFGVLLVLTTMEGICIFSLVFTRSSGSNAIPNFVLSECLELSDINTASQSNPGLLKSRRVRQTQSKVVLTTSHDPEDNDCLHDTRFAALVVLTSSTPEKSNLSRASASKLNVDAFTFPLKDHHCPVFQYSTVGEPSTRASRHQTSLNLVKGKNVFIAIVVILTATRSCSRIISVTCCCLRCSVSPDVSKVKSIGFLGNSNCQRSKNSLVVTVLLAGELKLIPIPLSMLFRTRGSVERHTLLQVQTILLAGLCAHPSISGLGEPVIMQSSDQNDDNATFDLAIMCRPKLNEIGYKEAFSTSPFSGLASTQKAVLFSPVEHIQEISATQECTKPAHFFPAGSKTPGRNVENKDGSEWETPRILTMPKIQIISPESEDVDTVAMKPRDNQHHQDSNENCKNLTAGELPFLSPLDSLARSASTVLGSPLVGLDLLSARSGTDVNNDSTIIITNTRNRGEAVDLTKWSPTSSNLNLTPLSDGLKGAQAEHSSTSQHKSNRLNTPANAGLRGFGPHSALKSIQCTTPAHAEKELTPNDISPDELSHIVVVHVEQEICDKKDKRGGAQLKIGFLSVSLPHNIAKFDSASLKWEAETNRGKHLMVVTTEIESLKLVKLSLRDGDFDSTEFNSVASHDLGPLFSELGREKKWSFKVKGVSINACQDPGNLDIRLLLYRQVKEKGDPSTMSSPINMSSTEATRVSLLATSLPLATVQPLTNSRAEASGGGANQGLAKKLDQIMNFMKSFEEKVDSRMDDLECRLGRLEESMRTV